MKKIKPKKIIDFVENNKREELLSFCRKIKYGDIYDSEQITEAFSIGIATLNRWRIAEKEFLQYSCCLKTRIGAFTNVFVSSKYKAYLISNGKALERHPSYARKD